MATFTRANAWNAGGNFNNSDLLWYAKAVGKMQGRGLDEPSSWWFFAAMHGEYVLPRFTTIPHIPLWRDVPAPPAVPTTPLPTVAVSDLYWDQCQHQSWYFAPWHRGYLIALEAQLRADVISLGGPATWALPYWNYFGQNSEFNIPSAFTQQNLPNGDANPLFVKARFGPDGDGNIYVPTPDGQQQHPNDPNFGGYTVTQDCMSDTQFSGSSTGVPQGFGGPVTGFHHGKGPNGGLEDNPHNLVHSFVGGGSDTVNFPGLMSTPPLAALDPIFYLHHANIDRMWAIWNQANSNPVDSKWLNGPTAAGDRKFVMPLPDGSSWTYTPQDVKSLGQLNYTYDDLSSPLQGGSPVVTRLTRLGFDAAVVEVPEGAQMEQGSNSELMGASRPRLALGPMGTSVDVRLDESVRRKVSSSLAEVSDALSLPSATPDRVFLKLENVRGSLDAAVLNVYIDLPETAKPGDHPELLAGSVGLFGMQGASLPDGEHAGQGLDFVLEITKIVDALHLSNSLSADSLQIRIVPNRALPERAEITIGRISIYRLGK